MVTKLPSDSDKGQIPTTNGMFFQRYTLDPLDSLTMEELIPLLRLIGFSLPHEHFDKLPDKTKKHFVIEDRAGTRQRWNKRIG